MYMYVCVCETKTMQDLSYIAKWWSTSISLLFVGAINFYWRIVIGLRQLELMVGLEIKWALPFLIIHQ